MNLLKQMTITGELRFGYALLSVEYTFENIGAQTVSPRYFFPVPEGAVIAGFQLLNEQKQLVRAKLCSITEEPESCGVSLRQLSTQLYCLQWAAMEQGMVCRVLLDILVPLVNRADGVRLVIPLGSELQGDAMAYMADCPVEITLYTGQPSANVNSVNHPVTTEDGEDGTVVLAQVSCGRDFVLDLHAFSKVSHGIVQEQWGIYEGVYRLCVQKPEAYRSPKPKKMQLVLDLPENSEEKQRNALKELCFKTLQAIPEGMPVQVWVTNQVKPLLPDFTPTGEAVYGRVYSALLEIGNDKANALPQWEAKDALTVVVSGGDDFCPKGKTPIHLFTLGDVVHTPAAERLQENADGSHNHFYPSDVTEAQVALAVLRLLHWGTLPQVVAEDGAVQELIPLFGGNSGSDGYLDIALRGSGSVPGKFSLVQDGVVQETIAVQQKKIHEHYPMAAGIYAKAKLAGLQMLLRRTDANSARAIKAEMEQVSLRYGLLSTETVLAVPLEGKRKLALPVSLYLGGRKSFTKPTIFGEKDGQLFYTAVERDARIKQCYEILKQHIRSDGSIFDKTEDKVNQTAWAVLALSVQTPKEFAAALQDAQNYLAKASYDVKEASALPELTKLSNQFDVVSAAQTLLRLLQ